MATATRRKKAAPEPVEEDVLEELGDDEELDDLEDPEEDDLDELDDEEEVEEAPVVKKRGRPAKAAAAAATDKPKRTPPTRTPVASGNDTNWLAGYINEICDTDYDSRNIRMLLRKMARDGELSRTVGEDRGRYEWPKGAADPEVKAIIRKVKTGAIEKTRSEGIAAAKASRTAKDATTAPVKKTARKAAPAAAAEEAPAPRRRGRPAAAK